MVALPSVKKCNRGRFWPLHSLLLFHEARASPSLSFHGNHRSYIHLNGTSGKDLWNEYHAAYEATKNSIDALCNATCNGRDFYPQGPAAFSQARSERDEALQKLREVKTYIEEVLMGIMAQQP
jgi:hypothetical protein